MVRRHKRKETHLLARFHQVEMGRKALRAEETACTAVRGQDEPEGERRVHHSKKFNVTGLSYGEEVILERLFAVKV